MRKYPFCHHAVCSLPHSNPCKCPTAPHQYISRTTNLRLCPCVALAVDASLSISAGCFTPIEPGKLKWPQRRLHHLCHSSNTQSFIHLRHPYQKHSLLTCYGTCTSAYSVTATFSTPSGTPIEKACRITLLFQQSFSSCSNLPISSLSTLS